ncbi:MAG: hypothetical protein IJT94_18930 [Oscillibacter sp.]|nr:hypothetical protein [Oscillibacter sp.]
MRKRLSRLLTAVLCFSLLLPASVGAAESVEELLAGIPLTLRCGSSEFEYIGHQCNQRAYHIGTAYAFVVESGGAYYALGEDLGAVALHLSDGVLSADSGVAEVTPEPSETQKNFTMPLPAKIGDSYLTITALNGPLALSAEKSFVWYFTYYGEPATKARFFGSVTDLDTSVSGYLTFQNGTFGSIQNNMLNENNLYIYQKVCPHINREEHPETAATCTTGGNQGYFICKDCGSWVNEAGARFYYRGTDVYMYGNGSYDTYATGHHYVNGVCTHDPSHIALEYEPVTAETDLFEEGYRYIIAAPDSGNIWKVMDFDPAHIPDIRTGCTGVMGSDGNLRIDNSNDGRRSAAEFRITQAVDESAGDMIVRVPASATDTEKYGWGLWAPDNGSRICRMETDSGYMLFDNAWIPSEYSPHPYSILVREDGIAEVEMLTFSGLIHPIVYGSASVNTWSGDGPETLTCFYAPGYNTPGQAGSSAEINTRLFRAKAPEKYAVNTQIAGGVMRVNILSDGEQSAVLAVCGYDADGRLTACETEDVTLTAGTVQAQVSVGDAAEYRVFLLDAATYLPLNVKQYKQDA